MEVFEILEKNAKLCEEKAKQYGNTYKQFGVVMNSLFPNGILLQSEKDFEIFGVYLMIIHKLTRITGVPGKLLSGELSMDSVTDLSVYAAMLEKVLS